MGLEEHELTIRQQRDIADASRVDEEMEGEERDGLRHHVGGRGVDGRQRVEGVAQLRHAVASPVERRGRSGPGVLLEKRADTEGDVCRDRLELDVLETERAGRCDARLGERPATRPPEPRCASGHPSRSARAGRPRRPASPWPDASSSSTSPRSAAASARRSGLASFASASCVPAALRGCGCGDRVAPCGVERALVGIGGGQALERRERVGPDLRDVDLRELAEAAREGIERHRLASYTSSASASASFSASRP